MRTIKDRVRTVFRHLHPHKPSDRGHQEWFRRELDNRVEIVISASGMHKWLNHGLPEHRRCAVTDVLESLESEARIKTLLHLAELR